jgi:hypothetical protein
MSIPIRRPAFGFADGGGLRNDLLHQLGVGIEHSHRVNPLLPPRGCGQFLFEGIDPSGEAFQGQFGHRYVSLHFARMTY